MLCSLLIATAFSADHNIERGLCWGNIDGWKYDLSYIDSSRPYFLFYVGDYEYYFKFCTPMRQGDLNDPDLALKGHIVYRTKIGTHNHTLVATVNDYDYKFIDEQDPQKGFYYYSYAHSYKEENGYELFNYTYVMECDENVTLVPPYPDISGYISGGITTFVLKYRGIWGCPKRVRAPDPTPEYKPDCTFVWRNTSELTEGVSIDLEDMTRGPYGNRYFVYINGVEHALFHQPCGRMRCPIGYRCEEQDEFSSSWLCPPSPDGTRRCVNYGINDDIINARLTKAPLYDQGITITQSHQTIQGQETIMNIICDESLPQNYFEINPTITQDIKKLYINARSKNVCSKKLNPPASVPPKDLIYINSYGSTSLDLNLLDYTEKGYKNTHTVQIHNETHTYQGSLLHRYPEAISCPSSYDCSGNEDATTYLCFEGKCTSYSFVNNSVSITPYAGSAFHNGLLVKQTSDAQRSVNIHYVCDSSVPAGSIRYPDHVYIRGRDLFFDMATSDVCPTGGSELPPTPAKWYPAVPFNMSQPTPRPLPKEVYEPIAYNLTHFSKLYMKDVEQAVFNEELLIYGPNGGEQAKVRVVFHPSKLQDCPSGYTCERYSKSHFWACWNNKCYPYGDNSFGLEMDFIDSRNPDLGVQLKYKGLGESGVTFFMYHQAVETSLIPLTANNVIYMNKEGRFHIYTKSSYGTPVKLSRPPEHKAGPATPLPDYNKNINYYFKHPKANQYVDSDLNLSVLLNHKESALFEIHDTTKYERSTIYLYPTAPGSCPDGYTCTDSYRHNVYKCYQPYYNEYSCIPIGDAFSEFSISSFSNEINDGYVVKYGGGFSNLAANFRFTCDPSLEKDHIYLGNVVSMSDKNTYEIHAFSSIACPTIIGEEPGPDPSVIDRVGMGFSIGSWFFIILVLALVVYFIYCAITSCAKDGRVTVFPHSNFWREFYLCFVTGAGYVFTCGKRETKEETEYEHMDL